MLLETFNVFHRELSSRQLSEKEREIFHLRISQADAAVRCKRSQPSGLFTAVNQGWQSDRDFEDAKRIIFTPCLDFFPWGELSLYPWLIRRRPNRVEYYRTCPPKSRRQWKLGITDAHLVGPDQLAVLKCIHSIFGSVHYHSCIRRHGTWLHRSRKVFSCACQLFSNGREELRCFFGSKDLLYLLFSLFAGLAGRSRVIFA